MLRNGKAVGKRAELRMRGAGLVLLGLSAVGCMRNRIIGSKRDAFIPAFEFRGKLARRGRTETGIYASAVGFEGKVDAVMDMYSPVSHDFHVSGDLQCGFGRLGVEFSFFRGPRDEFAYGAALGVVGYGFLRYDYFQGATPVRQEADSWFFPCPPLNCGFFVRARLAERALVRAEYHAALGAELFSAGELMMLIEYDIGAGVRVSAGWRQLHLHADDGPMEVTFDISGLAVGIVIAL